MFVTLQRTPDRLSQEKNIAVKLQKIFQIEPTLPFTEFDFLKKYRSSFESSELGRIYQLLPLKELATLIYPKLHGKHPQGRKPLFPLEGEIALMFLRSYTGLSDDGLVEMLNGNLHMQMFCGVLIDPTHPLKHTSFEGRQDCQCHPQPAGLCIGHKRNATCALRQLERQSVPP